MTHLYPFALAQSELQAQGQAPIDLAGTSELRHRRRLKLRRQLRWDSKGLGGGPIPSSGWPSPQLRIELRSRDTGAHTAKPSAPSAASLDGVTCQLGCRMRQGQRGVPGLHWSEAKEGRVLLSVHKLSCTVSTRAEGYQTPRSLVSRAATCSNSASSWAGAAL